MNIKSAATSLVSFVAGVILVSMLLLVFLGYWIGSSMKKPTTTVIVEDPLVRNYHGWWGHYGRGLPGWGGGYRPPKHAYSPPAYSPPAPAPSTPPAPPPPAPAPPTPPAS